MQASNVTKVVGAFLAGVVIVMGGALIYSRSIALRHPIQAVQTAAADDTAHAAATSEDPSTAATQGPASIAGHDIRSPAPAKQRIPDVRASRQAPQADQSTEPFYETLQNNARPAGPNLGSFVAAQPQYHPAAPKSPETQQLEPPPQLQSAPAQQPQYSSVAQPSMASAIPPPQSSVVATLQPGTDIAIRLVETLSSERNHRGDTFRATLDSPILVNGFVIADKGSTVFGRIAYLERAHLIGGQSDLTLILTEITTKDGQLLTIQTSPLDKEGARGGILETAKGAAGSAVGAVVGAVSGAVQGAGFDRGVGEEDRTSPPVGMKDRVIVLPAGTRLAFRVASPLSITATVN
ncbi:MAG: hypothetical protein WB992_18150 [Bryobacteraceae bacterium]